MILLRQLLALCLGFSTFAGSFKLRPTLSPLFSAPAQSRRTTLAAASTTTGTASLEPEIAPGPVIIGAGPIGLACALMLARKGYTSITVYDRLAEYPSASDTTVWSNLRSYIIGLNGRGQKVLSWLGVMDRINSAAVTVMGRRDWSPESDTSKDTITDLKEKGYYSRCITRDRLAACILEEIKVNYADKVTVHFGVECTDVKWLAPNSLDETCRISLSKQIKSGEIDTGGMKLWDIDAKFVIGSDGANSKVRSAMEMLKENKFVVKRYVDKNVRVYKTIPMRFPPNDKKWRGDLNYSARSKSDINIDALPTIGGEYLGVVLFRPWDVSVTKLSTGEETRKLIEKVFPMFSPFMKEEDLEEFAKKEPSKFPTFMYCSPVLHKGRTTCLLGDSIHTVKPYFGQGVNSAFEDILVLGSALDEAAGEVPKALQIYSSKRAKDAKALVELSQQLDGGFLRFILPLIVDSVCNKVAPWIFAPNTIRMLQNEKMSFSSIQARKRLNRVVQFVGLGLTVTLLAKVMSISLATLTSTLSCILRKNRFLS